MKKITKLLIATLLLSLITLTGCSTKPTAGDISPSSGTIVLRVNPEIAISYDENGNVTNLQAKNDDGVKILQDYTGFEGKNAKLVVSELVNKIGQAGYFVEIEGQNRQITIEIEKGSKIPTDTFIDEIVAEVQAYVSNNQLTSPIIVDSSQLSDYGLTDYDVTDYDVTDYDDNDTDYDDTDYGPNNDGVTDFDDTDYGPNNDGVTDYSNYHQPQHDSGYSDYSDYNDSGYSDFD
ncbi:MAG: hypothetical protein WBH68_06055 [Erysipelotrichaceae bacterium]|jgi:predicted small secreted protein|nr:hypothetical protein [Bacillota bacterium]NLP22876.1 hypothetical protein [Erysipelotrichaceae bacterium]